MVVPYWYCLKRGSYSTSSLSRWKALYYNSSQLCLKLERSSSAYLALICNGSYEVVLLGNLGGFHDLGGRPFAGSPVVCQVQVADALSEALYNLLHGCTYIWTMRQNDVHITTKHVLDAAATCDVVLQRYLRLLQALKRRLQTFDYVLLAETTCVWLFATCAEEYFGRENILVARPVQLFEGL